MTKPCDRKEVRGTRGYAEQAPALIARYETLQFPDKHREVMHLLPPAPTPALDIGAGTGADAAWLADRGHPVLAVEPTEPLRRFGIEHHPSPRISWLDDSLPSLDRVRAQERRFGLVMVTAVWMHLDAAERRQAMPVVAGLLEATGVLLVVLRHGPVPEGRLMHDVSAVETIALARDCGLRCCLQTSTASRLPENRHAGVTWSRLAFRPASALLN